MKFCSKEVKIPRVGFSSPHASGDYATRACSFTGEMFCAAQIINFYAFNPTLFKFRGYLASLLSLTG